MVAMPLAHVSWAIADNADRPVCDAFFLDVFGAQTAFEMLVTPETAEMGLDREERLMMISDTMVIPIAAAGKGAEPGNPIGEMLRRSSGANRWLGVALKVADLPSADAWLQARGFKLHYDPGMEAYYFLIGRGQAMGMRIEVLVQDLPGDPRRDPEWTPAYWREEHPLGMLAGIFEVDRFDAEQSEVALVLLGRANLAGNHRAGAQPKAADLARRHIDVVGAGQVVRVR